VTEDARSEDGDGRSSVKPTVKLYESRSRARSIARRHKKRRNREERGPRGEEGGEKRRGISLRRPCAPDPCLYQNPRGSYNFKFPSLPIVRPSPLNSSYPSIFIPPASSCHDASRGRKVTKRAGARALPSTRGAPRCDTSATLIRNSVDLSIKFPVPRRRCQYCRQKRQKKKDQPIYPVRATRCESLGNCSSFRA